MIGIDQETVYRALFHGVSLVTDCCPRSGAWLLDEAVDHLLGNRLLLGHLLKKNVARLRNISDFRRLLVISDLNIGDAINVQAGIRALREYFQDAQIDYVFGRCAHDLVRSGRDISRVFPVLTGSPRPNDHDLRIIDEILRAKRYDVVFNFCPFITDDQLHSTDNIIGCYALVSTLARNQGTADEVNQIGYQTYEYIHTLFSGIREPEKKSRYTGVQITISDAAIDGAHRFLCQEGLADLFPRVLYNPDTSCRFTRIPLQYQFDLVERITALPQVQVLLLGAGQTKKNLEGEILSAVSSPRRKKIVVVPSSIPLGTYAALIDACDVYVTGDTGPLHIAAARKVSASNRRHLRNRTAILSAFGATPARIYGYDSHSAKYFPADQDAPSHVYVSESPCRNLTCANKTAKTCRTARCFEYLDTEKIVEDIESYLDGHRLDSIVHGVEKEPRLLSVPSSS